jgi:hypothetical protein
MKAMFVIHENDPHTYFEIMERMKVKMHEVRGSWWCSKHWSEKYGHFYYEYTFEAEDQPLGILV